MDVQKDDSEMLRSRRSLLLHGYFDQVCIVCSSKSHDGLALLPPQAQRVCCAMTPCHLEVSAPALAALLGCAGGRIPKYTHAFTNEQICN